MKKNFKKRTTLFFCIAAISLILVDFSFAATATFYGEITDDGGDPNLEVWFQYGKTSSFGYETPRQTKYGTGEFTATVFNLDNCTTYYYRAVAKHQNLDDTKYGEIKSFTTDCPSSPSLPSVDLKANGSDGPITFSPNTTITLSWISSNASSCVASGDWQGTKPTSGSELIGKITEPKIFILTCQGSGGSASDSVRVNITTVAGAVSPVIEKRARNLSKGQIFFTDYVIAEPGEVLEFQIIINPGSGIRNAILKDALPEKIFVRRNSLKVNRILTSGDLFNGISLGNLNENQTTIITFWADVSQASEFSFGSTNLTNTANLHFEGGSVSDSVAIEIKKAKVLGVTNISTGQKEKIVFELFVLFLILALVLKTILNLHLFDFNPWLNIKIKELISRKKLRLKISKFSK